MASSGPPSGGWQGEHFEDVALSSSTAAAELDYDNQPALPPSYEEATITSHKTKPIKPAPPYCGIDAGPAHPPPPPPPPRPALRAAAAGPPPHNYHQPPSIMAGKCAAFEAWLASKTGLRVNIVILIMSTILVVIAKLMDFTLLIVLCLITGLVALALLVWAASLRRMQARQGAWQAERQQNLDRVRM